MRVVGIDVGGPVKGFHAVAMQDGAYFDQFHSAGAAETVAWVRCMEARALGIDAPCRWSADGHMRSAERELARLGISCFATPSRGRAEGHRFYAWMLNGMVLYERLSSEYRLLETSGPMAGKICFETFPQAIACALAGRKLPAKNKRTDRRELLEAAGIVTSALGSIDFIDAALCALAAHRYTLGRHEAIGDAKDGFIIVPKI